MWIVNLETCERGPVTSQHMFRSDNTGLGNKLASLSTELSSIIPLIVDRSTDRPESMRTKKGEEIEKRGRL